MLRTPRGPNSIDLSPSVTALGSIPHVRGAGLQAYEKGLCLLDNHRAPLAYIVAKELFEIDLFLLHTHGKVERNSSRILRSTRCSGGVIYYVTCLCNRKITRLYRAADRSVLLFLLHSKIDIVRCRPMGPAFQSTMYVSYQVLSSRMLSTHRNIRSSINLGRGFQDLPIQRAEDEQLTARYLELFGLRSLAYKAP